MLDETGRRKPGIRFRVPVSVGATEFSSLDRLDELGLDSVDALSVVPGVEVEIPMSDRWSLKPLVYLGIGTEMGGAVDAKIFRTGLRSRRTFTLDDTTMQLFGALGRIGYSDDTGGSDALDLFKLGLDFSRPLENTRIGGETVAIHWHIMYTRYLDSLGLDLASAALQPTTIGSEWELGTAFSRRSSRLRLWRLRFDRVGLAYRFGADGEFSGVGVVLRSLFDR